MSERILVCAAWPYANGLLHLGHIAGAYLPADIFARYHRLKGNQVLMVSGSDQHGTPITIKAEQEGKTPREVASHYHQTFLETWQQLGISFDLFTTTETLNHAEVTGDIFLKLLDKGYIYKDVMQQPYCPKCQRFLPDRYVEGTCPLCRYPQARGDQCDSCGHPMNPAELTQPQCRICSSTPVFKETEHFFLRLSAFQDELLAWVRKQTHWRSNVLNFTQRYLEEGLKDRAITRDIDWGIPLPVRGYPDKRIYVWFEAVIGYLSASKEWAKASGDPDKWRAFWEGDARSYYFIGKDNIPFHTIIWPAMLMGYGNLNLPYDVPANEWVTIESGKFSKSKNRAIWVTDFLSRYEPDPLRYTIAINMPETNDTDFSWREFFRRNNDELVATYGNLVHRVLTMVYRNFEGSVPRVENIAPGAPELANSTAAALAEVGELLSRCNFKQALKKAMGLAAETNRFLDERSPWKTIKGDRAAAASALYAALNTISGLKTMLYPFLPASSQKLHHYLGFGGRVEDAGWQLSRIEPGQKLNEPKPLFNKLDEKLAEAETRRLGENQ
ncbi:MAG: methionine--tRNA ligase [Chloroflexota bacterium]